MTVHFINHDTAEGLTQEDVAQIRDQMKEGYDQVVLEDDTRGIYFLAKVSQINFIKRD